MILLMVKCRLPGQTMSTFVVGEQVLKAEAMNLSVKHLSYKSNQHISILFETMCTDSDIAKQFTCGKDKSSYLVFFFCSLLL